MVSTVRESWILYSDNFDLTSSVACVLSVTEDKGSKRDWVYDSGLYASLGNRKIYSMCIFSVALTLTMAIVSYL